MNLDINHMANQINQERLNRRVVREYESLPRTGRHPAIIRFGAAISRFGRQLQGIPVPSAPEFDPCPDPASA